MKAPTPEASLRSQGMTGLYCVPEHGVQGSTVLLLSSLCPLHALLPSKDLVIPHLIIESWLYVMLATSHWVYKTNGRPSSQRHSLPRKHHVTERPLKPSKAGWCRVPPVFLLFPALHKSVYGPVSLACAHSSGTV